jgi:hypothetical protein
MPRTSSHDDPNGGEEEVAAEPTVDLPEPEGDDVLPLTDFEKQQAVDVAEAEKAEAEATE